MCGKSEPHSTFSEDEIWSQIVSIVFDARVGKQS